MYAGISGMKANQTKMDVIGNNVSNVGTTSFKKSSTRFQDALNQTIYQASQPSENLGGTNPSQVGIGVKVSGIYKTMGQGALQPTGRPLDIAIDGDGFFMVAKGPVDGEVGIDKNSINSNTENLEIMYTRDGSFSLDSEGYLVTSDGYRILGYGMNDTNENVNQSSLKSIQVPEEVDGKGVIGFTVSNTGVLSVALQDGSNSNLGQLSLASFKNPEGLISTSGNKYTESQNSGDAIIMADNNSKSYGAFVQGAVEMSNVDLSEEFTEMILTTRAFQASSKIISTSDELLQEIINLKR
jgi:flagellar hook protein FlgE